MSDLFTFALLGLGPGAVTALLGLGVVAIYRGSGVLNFAHGAVGMYVAYVFVILRQDQGLPTWLALALALVVAALLGLAIHLLVIQPLLHAPILARVTGTLGVLLTLQAVAFWQFGPSVRSVDPLVPAGAVDVLGVRVPNDRILILAVAVAVCAVLWAVYRFTLFGLATRAAAESEKGAALSGYSQAQLAATNWMIGAVLAGLGGILIAPLARLSSVSLTLLVVPALAAALVGRLENLWAVLGGGLAIGIGQSLVARYAPTVPGLSDSLPFLVIVVLLAWRGSSMPQRGELITSDLPRAPVPRFIPLKLAVLIVVGSTLMLVLPARYAASFTVGLIGAVIVLSLVVIVGYVGQISLAQLAFAGVGAYAAVRIGNELGLPFPVSIFLGGLVAIPVGLLIALPALRVRGINLAIVTLGAGLAFERMVFNNSAITRNPAMRQAEPPELLGFSLDGRIYPDRYGIFVLLVLALCLLVVANLRRSGTGRTLLAIRSDEAAAAACGINVTRAKLQAFAIAAWLAGIGGALEAYRTTFVSEQQFSVFQSIFFLAVAYIGGIATIGGAAIGILFIPGNIVGQFLSNQFSFDRLVQVLSGVGLVLTVVTQPSGLANLVNHEKEKRRRKRVRRERAAGSAATSKSRDEVASVRT